MKFRIFALLTLLITLTYCSKSNKPEDRFLSDLENYSQAYNNRNWEKVADMIYPKLFTFTTREEMIKTMSKLDSVGLKMNFNVKSIEKISEIIPSGNEKFCRIDYKSLMLITVEPIQLPNLDLYKESFEKTFGKENIKYDDNKKLFTINAHQTMIAVSDKKSDTWKYVEFNSGQADYMTTQLIPEDVLKKIKN
jgi:hypothetical protein